MSPADRKREWAYFGVFVATIFILVFAVPDEHRGWYFAGFVVGVVASLIGRQLERKWPFGGSS